MKERRVFGNRLGNALRGSALFLAAGSLLLSLGACGDDAAEKPPEEIQDDGRRWCLWLGYEYTTDGNQRDHFRPAYGAETTSASGTCRDPCDFNLPLRECPDEVVDGCPYAEPARKCVLMHKYLTAVAYQMTTCEGLADPATVETIAAYKDIATIEAAFGFDAGSCTAAAAACPKLCDFAANPYVLP